jgi:hypothetical protein
MVWCFVQFFSFQCHHMSLMDFVVSPPSCGRSVTDLGWDAHEAQLSCSDEVDGDTWIWSTRRGFKPKFYLTTQTMVTMGIFPFKEKSPWKNRESKPGPHDQQSETLTTRPWGWSVWYSKVKVQVKFTLEQAIQAVRGSRGKALLFL